MQNNSTMKDFPFKSSLTLEGLITYWRNEKNTEGKFGDFAVRQIDEYLSKHPEINKPEVTDELLSQHCDFIDFLMSVVIPLANVNDVSAAYKPFSFDCFYETKGHKELIKLHGSILNLIKPVSFEEITLQKTVGAYAEIMRKFYQVDLALDKPILLQAIHPETGLINYYKVAYNTIFCGIKSNGKLPELTDPEIKEMVANPFDLELWNSKLPYDLFEFNGFTVYTFIDVTAEESISQIKESLLNKDSIVDRKSFANLEKKFQSLLKMKDLKIGISGYNKNKSCFIDFRKGINRDSRLDIANLSCMESQQSIYAKFKDDPSPFIVNNVEESNLPSGIIQFFLNKEVKSLIISPLFYENKFIGILEMGSKNVGELNSVTATKIETALPLLSIALKRSTEEMENRVQSVIKEKYTSIHPTVEWHFLNAAYDIIEQGEKGEAITPPDILFEDVYPLYGASDIRGSSTIRNTAIKKDLKKQLKSAKGVVKQLYKQKSFPFLEELEFQISKLSTKISKGMLSGDETNIIHFLQKKVEPVFKKLEKEEKSILDITNTYWQILDDKLGVVYDARSDFEKSLTTINNTISQYIEKKQVDAQKVFPHFFEKYKSDGVEYNMYIGQSLTNEKEYHPIYSRNLKIWQLITMAEIARTAIEIMPELPLPLETTHLILAHNSTLSVEFRMDEKVFDVNGAYNMRYEIVKKRIDKALVDGTDERITQPGKITIVYSQDKDAEEYMGYIEFLQSKGYFTDDVEKLAIEPLQGVVGLKAIRVTIDQPSDKVINELEKMDFIQLSGIK